MSNEVVIQVENLSKQYRLGEVSTGSLGHDLNRWRHRVLGKEDPYLKVTQTNVREESTEQHKPGKTDAEATHQIPSDYVWALRDISFEVKRGEVLGIIGRNGAGKSTLLKILSRITAPTKGEVRMDGRIGALLEVGTGFHQDLTGRENIYLNGAILGMTKAEIRSKLDEIVDFSGCARYLDTPVKRYSSGMVVRLGFAVAAHLEPEILIVDEVLAVGDAEFQRKCIGKMQDVASHGRTVLFVSHNMASVQSLCTQALCLSEGGVCIPKRDTSEVISAYEDLVRVRVGEQTLGPQHHRVLTSFRIQQVDVLDAAGKPTHALKYGEPLCIRLRIRCAESHDAVEVGVALRRHGVVIGTLFSQVCRYEGNRDGYELTCTIPGGTCLPGLFELDVGASGSSGRIPLDHVPGAAVFTVSDVGIDDHWVYNRYEQGVVRLPALWNRLE